MIYTIAWHEFWFTVKRKSYYLVTFGMPLLMLGYLGMFLLIVLAAAPGELKKLTTPVGVIDRSGILTETGAPLDGAILGQPFVLEGKKRNELSPESNAELTEIVGSFHGIDRKIMLFSELEEAKTKLEDKTLRTVVEIPTDYVETGGFNVYRWQSDLMTSASGMGWLSKMIGDEMLSKTELTEMELARIQKNATTTEYEVGESGDFEKVDSLKKMLSLGVPFAVAGLLVVALMMNASLLLASIAEEKENKVMEVLVSSVSADSLLFGKVLGIVLAGLFQITIWMAMVSIVPGTLMFALKEQVDYDINVIQLLISVVFMMMGFLFYGSLLVGMGSLGSTYKDCQQLSAVVIICACVPMMTWMLFISDPNGIVPRVLSFIPLFSPVGMALRLGGGDIPMWEVALSFIILVVSTWLAVKIAARLFRAGTLMQGKSPGIFGIWKVLTQA